MTMTKTIGLGSLLVLFGMSAGAAEHEHHHDHGGPVPVVVPAEAPRGTTASDGSVPAELAPHAHMQSPPFVWAQLDQLERRTADGEDALAWDGRISWGGSFDRLWLRTEGERVDGQTEAQETQLYGSHAVARWWDATLGLRQDSGEGPSRRWLAVGVQGLAPYWFELAATAFVGESGRTALRLAGEYELLLSNRLILQPELELELYGQDDVANRLGAGLATSELGLRLRYEFRREFAPYLGVRWQRYYGDTADLVRADGERVGEAQVLAGVRLWY